MSHSSDPHGGPHQPSPYDPGQPPDDGNERSVGTIGVAIAAVLVLVGGGVLAVVLLAGGSQSVADDPTAPTESTADATGPTTDPTTDATSGTTSDTTTDATTDATTDTTTDTTGPPTASADDAEYCQKMGVVQATYSDLDITKLTNDDLDAMRTGLDELKPIAPPEVKPDLREFTGGMGSLTDLLDELGVTITELQDPAFIVDSAENWTPEQIQQLQEVSDQLIRPEFLQAGRNLDSDYRNRC